jgi:hypothetical protein
MWDLWLAKWHWDVVFSEFFGFPCQYHSTVAPHNHVLPERRTIGSLVAAVSRQTNSIAMNNNKTTYRMWTKKVKGKYNYK